MQAGKHVEDAAPNERDDAARQILLIGGDEHTFHFLRLTLDQISGSRFRLLQVGTTGEAAAHLKEGRVDMCLMNFDTDRDEGLAFLQGLASSHFSPPVILIADGADRDTVAAAMEAGAADHLRPSDLTWESLDRALRYVGSQHRYKAELWRSRDHYRKIVAAAINAIVAVDQNGSIIEWNPQAERLFGWRRVEVLGRALRDVLIPPRLLQVFDHEWEKMTRGDFGMDTTPCPERRVIRKDGSEIPVNVNVTRIADENGVIFVAFYEDLTLVKEGLEATRRYERIFQSTSDFVALLDRDFRYVAANQTYARAFDRPLSGIVGRTIHELFDASTVTEEFVPRLRDCLDGRETAYETWITFPTFGRRYMSIRYNPYRDEMGQVTGIVIHAHDITERKTTEEELDRSNRLIRQLYDENPAMFFTLDRDGTVLSANEYAAEVLGYSLPELIRHPVQKVIHAEDAELAREALAEAFSDPDSVHTWELRKRNKNGNTLWVRETARISTTPEGRQVALIVCEDISGAKALSEQLTYQATHDALTELMNRREFERRLGEALGDARQRGAEHALCFIDLDQFKVINDTCGHVAGDALLRELAGHLSSRIRRHDALARLGGDEFGVLIENCSLEQARHIASELHKIISDHRFTWEGKYFTVGASMGLVPVNQYSRDSNEALRLADTACYAAKDSGRNTIHVYDEADELIERRHGEMLWVERINRALEENRVSLACQPIVPVSNSGDCGHYEILVRLLGDDGQEIPPGAFLPAAERYGLIGRLDRYVVASWFSWLGDHADVCERLRMSSINLSGYSISDRELLHFIEHAADRHGIPRDRICFELTETSAIADLSTAVEFMNALRDSGFRFALDDFGSGLSSFAYLRTLPVNYVKIDGVFIREIAKNQVDRALVRSINDVAHTMGKQTIAEFVEDADALRVLQEIGVDFAQGYGVGRPRPVATLLADAKHTPKE